VSRFGDVLGSVLAMGISIGDITTVASLLGADVDELSDTQAAELLIAGLSQPSIELLVPETIAESIVGEQSGNLLARVSATLFEETGIAFPPITVRTPVGWRDDSYAIRINDVSSLVMRPLGADECLVNGTPEDLAAHTPEMPRSIIMPWAGRPAAVVPVAAVQQLSDLGWTVWSPTDYILAIAEHIIRTQAFKFVQQDRVFAQLETLERVHPAITKAALAELPLAQLTVLLRMLVRDGVSLGNLPAVLERVADRPAGLDGVARFDVLDDPVPPATELTEYGWEVEPMAAFVRVGLRDHIVQSVADGARCLSVYLLDPGIEKLVLSSIRRAADDDAVVDVFRSATARLAIGTTTPIVLTTPRVRGDLQEVLRAALPELRVLAFNEIPANLSLRPLERIALGGDTPPDSWADISDSATGPYRWLGEDDDDFAGGSAVRAVDITFPDNGGERQISLRGVPQRVCAQCGLPVFSAGALHRVEVFYREAVSGVTRQSVGVIP
jgi:type III secretory pathway component EscV